MSAKTALFVILGAVLLNACAEFENHPNDYSREASEVRTTACVIAFVNDGTTTFDMLDNEVGLDRRAAQNLVDHRNGGDGRVMTNDDNVIGDLGELRTIGYMGDAAEAKLTTYATSTWCAERQDQQLEGIYAGVGFTTRQLEMTLTVVNTATEGELQGMFRGNTKAAREVVENRELLSMDDVAALPSMGQREMMGLRAAAHRW